MDGLRFRVERCMRATAPVMGNELSKRICIASVLNSRGITLKNKAKSKSKTRTTSRNSYSKRNRSGGK